MFITARNKAIGLVFDISLRKSDGRRIVDQVKKQMAEWLQETLEESEDYFYLYHPHLIEPCTNKGSSLSWVAGYTTNGLLGNLRAELMQTYWVISAQDVDAKKSLIFITDRLQSGSEISRLLDIGKRADTDIRFIVIGIGKYYKKSVLDGLSGFPNVVVGNLDKPTELVEFLRGIDGEN